MKQGGIEEYLGLSPVMPVVVIDDAAIAVDLARALIRGGIRVIEVTLRTPAALRAIEAISRAEPDICVGAGTVLTVSDLHSAASAGAAFAISPGSTASLLEAGRIAAIPYLPAVASASELMNGLAAGYRCFKFFPAGAAGGIPMLKSFAGPFPDARFCPTGGITQDTVRSYLELPNVLCAGGSWLSPVDALAARDWVRIEALAAKAAASRGAARGG
jgi:2-dehydro-3-deoxyphosphogluconate aldolase/(4S)-4-hydroxy-2-oxoglutarate aldolase